MKSIKLLILSVLLMGCTPSEKKFSITEYYEKEYINSLYMNRNPKIFLDGKYGKISMHMENLEYANKFEKKPGLDANVGKNNFSDKSVLVLYLFLLNKIYSVDDLKNNYSLCEAKDVPYVSIKVINVGNNAFKTNRGCSGVFDKNDTREMVFSPEEYAVFKLLFDDVEREIEERN